MIQTCLESPANRIEMGVIRLCQALIHNCDFLRGRGVAGVEPASGYDRYAKRLKEVRSNIVHQHTWVSLGFSLLPLGNERHAADITRNQRHPCQRYVLCPWNGGKPFFEPLQGQGACLLRVKLPREFDIEEN